MSSRRAVLTRPTVTPGHFAHAFFAHSQLGSASTRRFWTRTCTITSRTGWRPLLPPRTPGMSSTGSSFAPFTGTRPSPRANTFSAGTSLIWLSPVLIKPLKIIFKVCALFTARLIFQTLWITVLIWSAFCAAFAGLRRWWAPQVCGYPCHAFRILFAL
jgi:hypothetical protein